MVSVKLVKEEVGSRGLNTRNMSELKKGLSQDARDFLEVLKGQLFFEFYKSKRVNARAENDEEMTW